MITSHLMNNKSDMIGESTPLLGDPINKERADESWKNDTTSNTRHRSRSTATHDVHTFRQQSRYKCVYIFLEALILVALCLMLKIVLEKSSSLMNKNSPSSLSPISTATRTHHTSHTFPTFLSTRDHENGVYLNALTNPLYEEMKHAHYISNRIVPSLLGSSGGDSTTTEEMNNKHHHHHHHHHHTTDTNTATTSSTSTMIPMLQLSTNQISYHDELHISWNTYNDAYAEGASSRRLTIQDLDIIAMYCPASEKDPYKFRDAATIAQVRRTSQENYNMNNNNRRKSRILNSMKMADDNNTDTIATATSFDMNVDTNAWWIPSFPIVRENTCIFRIWKRIVDDDTSTIHDGTITSSSTATNGDATTSSTSPNHPSLSSSSSSSSSSTNSFILVSHSDTLHITNGKEQPTLIHLALTSIPTEMRIHFTTGIEGIPIVLYGTNKASLLQKAYGTSTTYTKNDLCQEPASIEEPGKFSAPGMLHSIIMSDLLEDTIYFYQVAVMTYNHSSSSVHNKVDDYDHDDSTNNNDGQDHHYPYDSLTWSDIHSFRSPIFPGSTIPFSFVVYADQGVPGYGNRNMANYVTNWTEREVQQNQIRSVHHFGDLSYAQGVGHLWDQWLDMVSAFSSSAPLMIAIGNHEYDHIDGGENGKDPSGIVTSGGYMPRWGDMGNDSHGECGVPTSKRFIMPSNGNGVFWYSFNYGLVHTIVLSSEHGLSPSSVQYTWLENDRRKVNRRETPWLIVESHRPMYCSLNSPKDNLVGEVMRREFEHLLYQYKVDLFLAGYYHIYQRSCSGLYQSRRRSGGPTHINTGSAGADLDLTAPLLRRYWSFIRENGYGRISVPNSTCKR